MRMRGFEPPRPFGHQHLKLARLPFRHIRRSGNSSVGGEDAPGRLRAVRRARGATTVSNASEAAKKNTRHPLCRLAVTELVDIAISRDPNAPRTARRAVEQFASEV